MILPSLPSHHSQWTGSTDPADATGTATLWIGDQVHTLRLDSFRDYLAICRLLDLAEQHGRQAAIRALSDAIGRTLREHAAAVAPDAGPPDPPPRHP